MSHKVLVTSMLRHPLNGSLSGNALLTTSLLRHPFFSISGGSGGGSGTDPYPSLPDFPPTGVICTIYYAEDTGIHYYWNGTTYMPLQVSRSGVKEIISFSGASPKVITWDDGRKCIFGDYPVIQVLLSDGSGGLSAESIPCTISLTTSLPSSFSFETSGLTGFLIIT
jgi:hypothetical protein